MIQVDGPPSRWIVHGGRPSEVVRATHGGIPSYESDTGKILVYDLLIATEKRAMLPGAGRAIAAVETLFTPRGYAMVAARSVCVGDHELCALHDDPDAAWVWRPLIYRLADGLNRFGSQQELEWRWALHQSMESRGDIDEALGVFLLEQARSIKRLYGGRMPPVGAKQPGGEKRLRRNARKRLVREYFAEVDRLYARRLPFMEANDRADLILREHLCPQQRLDLEATGAFYVRGTINQLYRVEPGNGAQIVDATTRQPSISLCLHPERWMPHADVALATKLAIESGPEREEEVLAGARARLLPLGPSPTRDDRAAWERERHLLPAPISGPLRVS